MSDIISLADLRRLYGHPDHVLNHAIRRFGPEPRGRIGITRVWFAEDLPAIEAALNRTAKHSPEREQGAATA